MCENNTEIEKYKEYYKLTQANYNENYDTYNNIVDKASKLIPFLSIISGGILFCFKLYLDQYNYIKESKTLIVVLISGGLLITLINLCLVLYVMFLKGISKLIIRAEDNNYFVQMEENTIYYGLAQRYIETNEFNINVIQKKSKILVRAQRGMIFLIVYLMVSLIIILLIYK